MSVEVDVLEWMRILASQHNHTTPYSAARDEIERLRKALAAERDRVTDLQAHLELRKGCCLEAEELTKELATERERVSYAFEQCKQVVRSMAIPELTDRQRNALLSAMDFFQAADIRTTEEESK